MPLKQKSKQPHHHTHKGEKRTKHFMKVYAPFIPMLVIVGCGLFISNHGELRSERGAVKSYAINTSDNGLLAATNKERVAQGLAPLTANSMLDAAAQAKAEDMKAKNYWSHMTPEGQQPWVFIEAQRYQYQNAAENLAYGFETSNSTVAGWMNSPGHRANILDKDLQEVGFGIVNVPNYQNKGPETIVVAMYGKPVKLADNTSVQLPIITAPVSPTPQNISYVQSVTNGKAPWSGFIAGLLIGSIVMYLTVAHMRSLRRALRTSENFVIHHPVLDMTLIALVVLVTVATQSIGSIY